MRLWSLTCETNSDLAVQKFGTLEISITSVFVRLYSPQKILQSLFLKSRKNFFWKFFIDLIWWNRAKFYQTKFSENPTFWLFLVLKCVLWRIKTFRTCLNRKKWVFEKFVKSSLARFCQILAEKFNLKILKKVFFRFQK